MTGPNNPYPGQPQPGQNPYGYPNAGGAPQYGAPQYGVPQYGDPQQRQYGAPQYQQPYPAGGNQMGGAGRPGDLGARFGARVLDTLFVGIAVIIVAFVLAAIGFAAMYNFADAGTGNGFAVGRWIVGVVVSLVFFVGWVGYFVWMEVNRGQTFGKQICGLRVEGPNGGNPTIEQSLKRNAYVVIIAAGILINYILANGSAIGFIGAAIFFICWLAALAIVIVMAVTISGSPTKQGKHDEFAGGTRVVTTK